MTSVVENFSKVLLKFNVFLRSTDLRQYSDVKFKEDGSPVTSADLAIESLLKGLFNQYLPDFKFVGEESECTSDFLPNCVVVDPIDGTENFISGIPIWGVGIALFVQGQLTASAVFFPEIALCKLSSAVDSSCSQGYNLLKGPLSTSRVRAFSSNSNWLSVIQTFDIENRILGCSLFNLTLAALDSITFIGSDNGSKLWDIAAPLLFSLEAGKKILINGKVYHGQFLDPTSRYVVEIINP